MPTYEYRCENGHTFEVVQRMTDEPITTCQVCGAPVQRVFHPVAVHFKGSGFYNTDYGKRKRGAAAESSSDTSSSSDGKGGKDGKDKSESKGSGEKSASPAKGSTKSGSSD